MDVRVHLLRGFAVINVDVAPNEPPLVITRFPAPCLLGVADEDPTDVLNEKKCLEYLAALRHAKWFQVNASSRALAFDR